MGELARKPGCPELPKTPYELLTPRPGEGYSTAEKLSWPIAGVILGFGSASLRNIFLKRPFWAGLHVHFILALTGNCVFTLIRDIRFAERAEADAVLKHYISLHPDDFPPYERKRWRDVYTSFSPNR